MRSACTATTAAAANVCSAPAAIAPRARDMESVPHMASALARLGTAATAATFNACRSNSAHGEHAVRSVRAVRSRWERSFAAPSWTPPSFNVVRRPRCARQSSLPTRLCVAGRLADGRAARRGNRCASRATAVQMHSPSSRPRSIAARVRQQHRLQHCQAWLF